MSLTTLLIVVALLLLSLLLGLAVSWGRQQISDDYFLAGRSLPWYAVALSMAGSGFGLLYLLGMVGLAYQVGLAPAGFAWGNLLAYTALGWVFLPFFYRKKLYSPAEFIGRRYSGATQGIFAVLVLPAVILGVLAPALYAGGFVFCEAVLGHAVTVVDVPLALGILLVAVVTAGYTVYGGLSASAWTSVLQMVVLAAGGIVLAVAATGDASGLAELLQGNAAVDPARSDLLLPAGNAFVPWTGMLAFWLTLGLWHSAASPVSVQHCLGARSEWDAKMGVLAGGLLQVLLPAVLVLPGLALFLKHGAVQPASGMDRALLDLINATFSGETWGSALARGLVVAGVLAAVLSTASAALNAVAALWTVDVCRDLREMRDSEAEMVGRGRRASLGAIVLGTLAAPFMISWPKGVFDFVLEVAALVGPPIAVVFLLAFFLPRAHGRAAAVTLVLGAMAGAFLMFVARFSYAPPEWLQPVLVRAGLSGLFSLVVFLLGTVAIPANPHELYDPDTTWNPYWARLPLNEREMGAGPRNLFFWWVVLLLAMLGAVVGVKLL
jgi:solute:Na+ symporter, SSS family